MKIKCLGKFTVKTFKMTCMDSIISFKMKKLQLIASSGVRKKNTLFSAFFILQTINTSHTHI